jgi:hypothetical protein
VTKPGGWIELVEFTSSIENPGPNTKKISDWMNDAMMPRGINVDIAISPGLKFLLGEANVINVQEEHLRIPLHKEGGKISELLGETMKMSHTFIGPMVTRALGLSVEEYTRVSVATESEMEEYKSYFNCYMAWGQKQ